VTASASREAGGGSAERLRYGVSQRHPPTLKPKALEFGRPKCAAGSRDLPRVMVVGSELGAFSSRRGCTEPTPRAIRPPGSSRRRCDALERLGHTAHLTRIDEQLERGRVILGGRKVLAQGLPYFPKPLKRLGKPLLESEPTPQLDRSLEASSRL
jgi:hypothetical protein